MLSDSFCAFQDFAPLSILFLSSFLPIQSLLLNDEVILERLLEVT